MLVEKAIHQSKNLTQKESFCFLLNQISYFCIAVTRTFVECAVPKLSSSSPWVVIFPETPVTLNSKSPSNCIELYRILQLSSNRPLSSSGKNKLTAVSAYAVMIRCPALRDVARTNSDSSDRPWQKQCNCKINMGWKARWQFVPFHCIFHQS